MEESGTLSPWINPGNPIGQEEMHVRASLIGLVDAIHWVFSFSKIRHTYPVLVDPFNLLAEAV